LGGVRRQSNKTVGSVPVQCPLGKPAGEVCERGWGLRRPARTGARAAAAPRVGPLRGPVVPLDEPLRSPLVRFQRGAFTSIPPEM
jgi:hypothetical protein